MVPGLVLFILILSINESLSMISLDIACWPKPPVSVDAHEFDSLIVHIGYGRFV